MAKSTRRARGARVDVMEMWQAPKQAMPLVILGVLIRWRVELVVLAVWCTGMVWLQVQTDTLTMWLVFGGVVAVVFAIPHSRRFVVSRFWCVVDRHRLRTCLRNAKVRTMNLDGALPFMVWARPTKTGERVWMWTRAGSSADELEHVLGYIAPACYAREARLHRVRSMSTLVAVEIVRRDPLGKPRAVDSPLARLSTRLQGGKATTEGTEPISAATVTPLPVPRPATSDTASVGRTSRKTTGKTAPVEPARPAVVVNGEDLSDYID